MNRRLFITLLCGVIFGLLLFSWPIACRLPNLDRLNRTRTEPKKADLLGTWVLNKSSLAEMQSIGGYDIFIQPKLILRVDGNFELVHMPDWWDNGSGKSRKGFQDYAGSWGLSTYGNTGLWHVDLKSSSRTSSASLLGQSPPYSIEFIIGDPDSNVSMTFEKS